ncbi:uncharacterized protein LOC129611045 [Condylostylus longicornis]|uniref:uncharacterized protein LOC129611045 n=1 Tax=Condylostylus longicornis TaxID=2530218 RepID=UPI00244E08FB|nr:uncharacterized protein LOC129611045 [Condylostylus longicornis]
MIEIIIIIFVLCLNLIILKVFIKMCISYRRSNNNTGNSNSNQTQMERNIETTERMPPTIRDIEQIPPPNYNQIVSNYNEFTTNKIALYDGLPSYEEAITKKDTTLIGNERSTSIFTITLGESTEVMGRH